MMSNRQRQTKDAVFMSKVALVGVVLMGMLYMGYWRNW